MILYINTSDRKKISLTLKKGNKVVKSLTKENEFGSQVLLPAIVEITGGDWEMIKVIEVGTGPGSFTGLKVGVSVANALGFALGIPINGKKIEDKLIY